MSQFDISSGGPEAVIAPWMHKPLDQWSIVGMNHYHVGGERFLFVAMAKDGRCIKEEGKDDVYLWNRLLHKADALSGDGGGSHG